MITIAALLARGVREGPRTGIRRGEQSCSDRVDLGVIEDRNADDPFRLPLRSSGGNQGGNTLFGLVVLMARTA